MHWRIIDLSEEPASLSVRYDQLIIKRDEKEDSVPLEELAVLIVANSQVSYTQAVLAGICEHGASFIVCDNRKMPAGMILPLAGNFVQTERFNSQVNASIPTKKHVWGQIVKAKISSQANLIRKIHEKDYGLKALALKVRSGDAGNMESRAARIYWPLLFGSSFRRIPGAEDCLNSMLNYGYAVLRSIVSRAICASGLHPSIGVHHRNRYNPFCLADDIMEPFRPIVDEAVVKVVEFIGDNAILDKSTKKILIGEIYERRLEMKGESRNIFDAASRISASLADVFASKRRKLELPEF